MFCSNLTHTLNLTFVPKKKKIRYQNYQKALDDFHEKNPNWGDGVYATVSYFTKQNKIGGKDYILYIQCNCKLLTCDASTHHIISLLPMDIIIFANNRRPGGRLRHF
jgi:hypothetical protein